MPILTFIAFLLVAVFVALLQGQLNQGLALVAQIMQQVRPRPGHQLTQSRPTLRLRQQCGGGWRTRPEPVFQRHLGPRNGRPDRPQSVVQI